MSLPSKAKVNDTKEESRKGDTRTSNWLPSSGRKIVPYEESGKLDGTGGPRWVDDRGTAAANVTGDKPTRKGVEREVVIYEEPEQLESTTGGPRLVDEWDTSKVTGEKTKKG